MKNIIKGIMSVFSRKRYYLVAYGAKNNTFGRILICSRGELNIGAVDIALTNKAGVDTFVVSFQRISRSQYDSVP